MRSREDFQYNVAVVGASTLKGKEVNSLLEERGFPAGRIALLDGSGPDEEAAEAGEETAVVEAVSPESFRDISFVIFAGSPAFAAEHWQAAQQSECEIIDQSYGLEKLPEARLRAPMVECLLGSNLPLPEAERSRISIAAHPAAIALADILGQLAQHFPIARSAVTVFEPVSERGQSGVDELHRQTVNLFSFQEIPKQIFDSQVAFNLRTSCGERCHPALQETRERIASHLRHLLERGSARETLIPQPALRLLQAPIFFGYAVCCFVELQQPASTEEVESVLNRKPFVVFRSGEEQPSVLEAAGTDDILLGPVERDPACGAGYWIWAVMDNVRLSALNAVQIAEEIVFLGGHKQ